MDEAIAGDARKPAHPQPTRTGGKTARQVATEKYEKMEEEEKIKTMLKTVKERVNQRSGDLRRRKSLQALANV
jgi:hypothetical protein